MLFYLLKLLKNQFPNVQFITTSHSPLVASSVGQLLEGKNRDKLIHLELKDENKIVYQELESRSEEHTSELQSH